MKSLRFRGLNFRAAALRDYRLWVSLCELLASAGVENAVGWRT